MQRNNLPDTARHLHKSAAPVPTENKGNRGEIHMDELEEARRKEREKDRKREALRLKREEELKKKFIRTGIIAAAVLLCVILGVVSAVRFSKNLWHFIPGYIMSIMSSSGSYQKLFS